MDKDKLPEIKGRRRGPKPQNPERDAQIVAAVAAGATLAAAGEPWGLSRERVHAIYRRAYLEGQAAAEPAEPAE